MSTDRNLAEFNLDDATFLRLTNAAGTLLVCLEGCLWITQDGVLKDTQVETGEAWRIEGRGRFLVTGLGPSRARVVQPPRQARVLRGFVSAAVQRVVEMRARRAASSARAASTTLSTAVTFDQASRAS